MSAPRESISLTIPKVGKVEIDNLGYRFQNIPYEEGEIKNPLKKEMAVVYKNGCACLICHPDNLIELCSVVMSSTFIDEYTELFARGCDFWTDRRNVYGGIYTVEDNECIEELYDEFLDAGYIIKVESDELLKISNKNYVYVVPDYNSYRIEKKIDTYERCVLIVKKHIERLLEEEEEEADEYCPADEDFVCRCSDALDELDRRLSEIKDKKIEKTKRDEAKAKKDN